MTNLRFSVSSAVYEVVQTYAQWKQLDEAPQQTLMNDGWTLPSLHFKYLYEAHAASLDLAMVSGSLRPLTPHQVLVTEYCGDMDENEVLR